MKVSEIMCFFPPVAPSARLHIGRIEFTTRIIYEWETQTQKTTNWGT